MYINQFQSLAHRPMAGRDASILPEKNWKNRSAKAMSKMPAK